MGVCRACGGPSKRGEYCGPLCAIGSPRDTTHAVTNPTLQEPDETTQAWADRQWTEKLALERAGFTTDEAIQYLAHVRQLGATHGQ
ncbi:hypothetical protein [Arthrobacter sp. efr-133-TYG-118]|uniref:hypothetical protein n=1 Tax=Arthrobacter sp. efr-133-TYG-118 TaxID=3040279 RepID=UPI00254CD5B4|nr:hypothetical protein [Arthrobacter sp. efr-133-TYG-118]